MLTRPGLMAGKVVTVTGGGAGIGLGIAVIAALEDAAGIVLVDRDGDALQAAAALLNDLALDDSPGHFGGGILQLTADVTQDDTAERIVDAAVSTFGRLDCAVNNAGTRGDNVAIADCTNAEWDGVLDVNLNGLFGCMRAQLRHMYDSKSGAIVNIGSASVLGTWPAMAPYIASKSGVTGLTKAASKEAAPHGVRVNVVHPGITQTRLMRSWMKESGLTDESLTERIPLGRLGRPEDIGRAAIWLCSDHASFITGIALPVDGGRTG
jgi:NAD(P)-dependent dehydrogenase (short-subunit alcohol dehydrogenase family)